MALTPVSLGATGGSASASTIALTAGGAIQTGDLVVVAVAANGGSTLAVSGVSDGTNTYTFGARGNFGPGNIAELWYKLNATAVSSPVITATFNTGTPFREISASRTPGDVSGSLDKTANSSGSSSSPTVTTATLSSQPQICFGAMFVNNIATVTEDGNWTRLSYDTTSGSTGLDTAYRNVSATTAVTWSPTLGSSQNWAQAVLTFVAATNAYKLSTTIGSYSLTGVAARLGRVFTLQSAIGAYALSGIGPTMRRGVRMITPVGSYAVTGVSPVLKAARHLYTSVGSYSISGVAPVLRAARRIATSVGSYAVTGIPLIIADYAAPAGKFLIRQSTYILQKLRTTDPSLDQ